MTTNPPERLTAEELDTIARRTHDETIHRLIAMARASLRPLPGGVEREPAVWVVCGPDGERSFYDDCAEAEMEFSAFMTGSITPLYALSPPSSEREPSEWVLMPVQPTQHMLHRLNDAVDTRKGWWERAYAALIEARPTPPPSSDWPEREAALKGTLSRLEEFAKLDDEDKHAATKERDQAGRDFHQGRAAGLRTAITYIQGCGAIDCVNACDGDFTHDTCPNVAHLPKQKGES